MTNNIDRNYDTRNTEIREIEVHRQEWSTTTRWFKHRVACNPKHSRKRLMEFIKLQIKYLGHSIDQTMYSYRLGNTPYYI